MFIPPSNNPRSLLRSLFSALDRRPSIRRVIYLSALLTLPLGGLKAATYTFNPPLSATSTQLWSSGDNWIGGKPVSGSDTRLTFIQNNASAFSNLANITSQNDEANPFLLNILDLQGSKPTGASETATFTINGSPLRFVNNGVTGPVINVNTLSGTSTANYINYAVASNIEVANDLSITGNGNYVRFSGAFSGPGTITKTGTSTLLLNGINSGFTGGLTVNAGTVSFVGTDTTATGWVSSGALTIASGATVTTGGTIDNSAGTAAFGALYGAGTISSGTRRLTINYNGSATDVFSGTVGQSVRLEQYGSGTLRINNTITSNGAVGIYWGTLEANALTTAGRFNAFQGNFKVTNGGNTSVGGGSGGVSILAGGTLALTPTGSGSSLVYTASDAAGSFNNNFRMQGGRILIDRGSQNSLTFQVGGTANTGAAPAQFGDRGGIIIAAAHGLAALGSTEKMIFVNSAGTAAPALTNGGVDIRYTGQDNDSNLSGDFLTYSGTGTTGDTGFTRFDWSSATNADTNFASASATKFERVTSGTTSNINTQTIYALRNEGTVNLNALQTLTVSSGGVILNGGTVSGYRLNVGGGAGRFYTSLANGTVSASVIANNGFDVVGPGVLNLTGSLTDLRSTIRLFSGSTLDISNGTNGFVNGLLAFSGGVLQSQGTLAKVLGSSTTTGANNVTFQAVSSNVNTSGGFAARGGSLTVSLMVGATPNADLTWGTDPVGSPTGTANFLTEGSVFHFGSATADNEVIFTNNLNLGGNSLYFNKVINVYDNPNSSTDVARLTGNITSNAAVNGIVKDGAGRLILEGTNTYGGQTIVSAGTLQIGNGTTGTLGTGEVVNNAALAFKRSNAATVANRISGTGSVTQSGTGALTLSATNTYTGATQVTAGTLIVSGSVAASSGVNVSSGATLAGSGRVSAISGAGTVGPGNSPGILTATSVDFAAGLDLAFEMTSAAPTWSNATASGNDVLRLTLSTPIPNAANSSNTISVYFNGIGTFVGGLYTDQNANFESLVSGAAYAYYLQDAGGLVTYNGLQYSLLNPAAVTRTTLQIASANFADGTLTNGWSQQFNVAAIPEPSSAALLGLGAGALILWRRRRTAQ